MDSGTELFLRQEMGTNNNPALPPSGQAAKQKKWSAPAITLAGTGLPLGSVDEYSTEVNYDRRESYASSSGGGSRRGSAASGLGVGLLFASRRPSRESPSSRRGSESASSVSSSLGLGGLGQRRDSTPSPLAGLAGLSPAAAGLLDEKGAKGRRRSWHVVKLERKRRKGVTSPSALSDNEAPPKAREKRPSWWNIFATDKSR